VAELIRGLGFRAKMEGGQSVCHATVTAQNRDEPLQPTPALTKRVGSNQIGRNVSGDEGVDQVEGVALDHGHLDGLVGRQYGRGQQGVIFDAVVRVERQRKEPIVCVTMDHQIVNLGAAVQR